MPITFIAQCPLSEEACGFVKNIEESNFSEEENYLALKYGYGFLLEVRKNASKVAEQSLRESLESDFQGKIADLQSQLFERERTRNN